MPRQALTITLRKALIEDLDRLIDGDRIRNRSHAIEYILASHLRPTTTKAVILAGGHGVKMRPFTYEMPKPMLPVKGRPILEHIVELLRTNEIRELLIVTGPLGDKIRDHFGDGSKFGVRISYIEESQAGGTAAPLLKVRDFVGHTPFVMIYGDVLIDIKIKDLIAYHSENRALATLALTSISEPWAYGAVRLHGNQIVEFVEKPPKSSGASRLIFAGVSVIDPKLIDVVPKRPGSMLERDVYPKLAKERKLAGYLFEGRWFDVGTPEIYERVIKEW